jgi:hypothetical protein
MSHTVKVNLPAKAMQMKQCENQQLSQLVHTRHCYDKKVSDLVSAVFIYKSYLK